MKRIEKRIKNELKQQEQRIMDYLKKSGLMETLMEHRHAEFRTIFMDREFFCEMSQDMDSNQAWFVIQNLPGQAKFFLKIAFNTSVLNMEFSGAHECIVESMNFLMDEVE